MARGSIVERGNSYRVRISYQENGKRQMVTKTAPSRRQAEKLKTELLAEVDKGTFIKPSKLTVQAHLEQWLDGYVRSTVSPRTHELYNYIAHKHLIPALGAIPLSQLRPQHIQTLYADKLQQGLSPRTVQLLHVTLHLALANALRTGILARNPLDGVDPPKVERHEMKTMTEDDISRFLNEARKGEYYSLFFCLLFTGMRRGEALSLRWNDVDLLGCQLSINRTMQFLNNKVTFKTPKTASSRRQIALSPSTCVMLRLHREVQDNVRQSIGLPPVSDSDLIFCQYDGKPLLPNSVTHVWIKTVRRCGLDGIRLHDARHSHASLMLKNGTNPKVIQERLGHASFSTTMNLYAHLSPGMQKEAANRFDDMVVGDGRDKSVTIP
ncbi:MAG: tyrosine-type recombinase/integrase [Dehalococcoidales bacterium]|nr:tyrosine-type recombinase/integrase [Dehalococcoidales bacterium]